MFKSKKNPLGVMPLDTDVCSILQDESKKYVAEAYIYEVGYFRFNWHTSLETMIVLQGRLTVHSGIMTNTLKENDVLVINPYIGHATMLQEPGTIAAVLHISKEFIEKLIKQKMPTFVCNSSSIKNNHIAYSIIRQCFATVYLSLKYNNLPNILLAKSNIELLVATLLNFFSENKSQKNILNEDLKQINMVLKMIELIDLHYYKKLTLTDLTNITGMNSTYTSTFFKEHVGLTFYEYLTRKRLEEAVYLLNNESNSILEIALRAGFPDAKSFDKAFKKYLYITPRQYRIQINSKEYKNMHNKYPLRFSHTHPVVKAKMQEFLNANAYIKRFFQDLFDS